MPKLTETTNDKLAKRRGRPPGSKNAVEGNGIAHVEQNGNGLHIEAAHEPLKGEAFQMAAPNVVPMSAQQTVPPNVVPMPVQISYTPTITGQLTQSPQEQTVNEPKPAPTAEPQILKIACVGTAPSSRLLAPFNDPTWKIWGCSPGNKGVLPRADAWFEIHDTLLLEENKAWGPEYVAWLKSLPIPVFMQDQRYFPHAKSLPWRELVAEFGPHVFTSSFSWMMAMAIMEGAKEIGLFGIDMASRDEYILQRQAAYHFIYVEGPRRGVKIMAPYESDIMQPPALYGFSEATPFGTKSRARKSELAGRIASTKNEIAQMDAAIANKRAQLTYLEGAAEDTDYYTSIWGGIQNNSGPALIMSKP